MKTKVINLYSFSELSEEAKERAIEHYRYSERDYFFDDEIESIIKGLDFFGFKTMDYSVDYSSAARSSFSITNTNEFDEDNLIGVRLWKWLKNQKGSIIPAYGEKYKYKDVYESSCPFTGYYMDEVLLDTFRNFLKSPNSRKSLNDLIEEAIEACLYAIQQDYEYQNTDEYIKEELENMGEVFNEDGSLE